jgi:DNA-binding response OmpR family regulator
MPVVKTGRKLILVVDDEILLHRAIERAAAAVGIDVIHATNGTEGVRMAVERRPELVLLDMNMPDMDGSRVLARLKAAPQTTSIPVVIFSGRTDHEDRIAALGLGAEDYFEKPFELDMLMRRIEHHIFKASERIAKAGLLSETPAEGATAAARSKR